VHGRITTTGQYCGRKNHDAEPGVGETIGDSLPGAGGSSFITLYPNPTAGKFILETTSASTKQKVVAEIYSIQGKILIIKDISEGNRHELSVSDLPVGVYFIRVVSGDNVAIQRIIRQ
jgi:hypothetical protein